MPTKTIILAIGTKILVAEIKDLLDKQAEVQVLIRSSKRKDKPL